MELSQADLDRLKELEASLWVTATRCDVAYMEGVLAPDFFEFGCSGRIYPRQEILKIQAGEIRATLRNLVVLPIAENVVQITYTSEVIYDYIQRCNRSSIWVKTADGWRLRFHQGTPIPP